MCVRGCLGSCSCAAEWSRGRPLLNLKAPDLSPGRARVLEKLGARARACACVCLCLGVCVFVCLCVCVCLWRMAAVVALGVRLGGGWGIVPGCGKRVPTQVEPLEAACMPSAGKRCRQMATQHLPHPVDVVARRRKAGADESAKASSMAAERRHHLFHHRCVAQGLLEARHSQGHNRWRAGGTPGRAPTRPRRAPRSGASRRRGRRAPRGSRARAARASARKSTAAAHAAHGRARRRLGGRGRARRCRRRGWLLGTRARFWGRGRGARSPLWPRPGTVDRGAMIERAQTL